LHFRAHLRGRFKSSFAIPSGLFVSRLWFNRKTGGTWKVMVANQKAINKGYNKRNGRVMFPTSHDITEESIDNCLIILEKLFKSGNNVLITSKPQFICIKRICEKFEKYKNLIQFRFTITSINNDLLEFWEL